MKVVIVILLLVAVSFVAVMVYGVTRDEPAPPATARRDDGCGGPPPKIDSDDPDPDALEGWCPPTFGSTVTGIQERFGPKAEVDQPAVALDGLRPAMRRVPADEREFRVARIVLTSGRAARVRSLRFDGPGAQVCLCRPNSTVDRDDFDGCSEAWLDNQVAENCREGGRGSLIFGPAGGTLSFEAERPARLAVNPAAQDAED